MSLSHGLNPVRTGIHFDIDFANPKSINGLTLTDISGNNIPISLTNAGDNSLQIVDGYALFSPSTETGSATYYTINDSSFNTIKNEITLETVVYATVENNGGSKLVSPRITESGSPLGFGIRTSYLSVESNTNNGWITSTASGGQLNTWIHIIQTTSVTTNSFLTYVNGTLRTTLSLAGGIPNGGNGLLIGRGYYAGIRNATGRVSMVRVYNRALNSTEVKQNFESIRGRYGI